MTREPTNEQVAALSKHLREACGLTTTAGILTEAVRLVNRAALSASPAPAGDLVERVAAVVRSADVQWVEENGVPESADADKEWRLFIARAVIAAMQPIKGGPVEPPFGCR